MYWEVKYDSNLSQDKLNTHQEAQVKEAHVHLVVKARKYPNNIWYKSKLKTITNLHLWRYNIY